MHWRIQNPESKAMFSVERTSFITNGLERVVIIRTILFGYLKKNIDTTLVRYMRTLMSPPNEPGNSNIILFMMILMTSIVIYIKFARYMEYECDEYWKQGRRFRWRDITLRPLYMFLRSYVVKKGFRDGVRGFLISANIAYYNFMIFMKLWEREFYERQKRETGSE